MRTQRFVEWEGQQRRAVEVARLHGINPSALTYRVRAGWDLLEACTRRLQGKVHDPVPVPKRVEAAESETRDVSGQLDRAVKLETAAPWVRHPVTAGDAAAGLAHLRDLLVAVELVLVVEPRAELTAELTAERCRRLDVLARVRKLLGAL